MTATRHEVMHAIVQHRYGGPEVLELAEVGRPVPAEDGALVRVHAASLNALDWHVMRGMPYLVRATEGLRRPRSPVRGADLAGVVEAVGSAVTTLRPGDEVLAALGSACAEYVAGPATAFVRKPAALGFREAAALPVAGVTALQALRDKAGIRPGMRVLVTGAGGGVGSYAVQLAKAMGAEVIAATSPAKVEFVRSLGADKVLPNTLEALGAAGPYDAAIDVAGGAASLGALARTLTPAGTLVVVGAGPGQWVGPLLRPAGAAIRSRFGSRKLRPLLSRGRPEDIAVLVGYAESGAVRPVIDRTYPLTRTAEAMAHVESGQVRGKVVIDVAAATAGWQ